MIDPNDFSGSTEPATLNDPGGVPEPASANPGDAPRSGTGQAASGKATVAFCQQCGLALTADTRQAIGSGVFCGPCAAVRQHGRDGFTPVPGPTANLGSLPPAVGEPNPILAGFLGLIPGVGAMYNGQYPKGVIHLVIFVVLTSLADNLNWVLWWFVWGWIFYQAFEAYHTAQARRDGFPLPDPFGWNDLGERLGFRQPTVSSFTAQASRPNRSESAFRSAGSTSAATASSATSPYAPPPAASSAYSAVGPEFTPYVPPAGSDWHSPTPPVTPGPAAAAGQPGSAQPTYAPIYTGTPQTQVAPPFVPTNRFPTGAAWLIALGVLFLIANVAPGWRLEARWLVPALLTMLAVWTGGRRLEAAGALRGNGTIGSNPAMLVESLVGPILLLTVAVLLSLQTARVVWLRHSWPAFLIVWGALLLIGRSQATGASANAVPGYPVAGQPSAAPQDPLPR